MCTLTPKTWLKLNKEFLPFLNIYLTSTFFLVHFLAYICYIHSIACMSYRPPEIKKVASWILFYQKEKRPIDYIRVFPGWIYFFIDNQLVESSFNVICRYICFYEIISHQVRSRFHIEHSPVQSSKQSMGQKVCISFFVVLEVEKNVKILHKQWLRCRTI